MILRKAGALKQFDRIVVFEQTQEITRLTHHIEWVEIEITRSGLSSTMKLDPEDMVEMYGWNDVLTE